MVYPCWGRKTPCLILKTSSCFTYQTCISDINRGKVWKAQNGDWEMVRKRETLFVGTDIFHWCRLGLFWHICTLYLIWASPDWPLWSTVSTQGSNFVSIHWKLCCFLIALLIHFDSLFHSQAVFTELSWADYWVFIWVVSFQKRERQVIKRIFFSCWFLSVVLSKDFISLLIVFPVFWFSWPKFQRPAQSFRFSFRRWHKISKHLLLITDCVLLLSSPSPGDTWI